MYSRHKILSPSELEAAARRIPFLHLLPLLNTDEPLDVSWDEAGELTLAPGLEMTERDCDEVVFLA